MSTVSSATHTVAAPTILDANFVVPAVVLAFLALNLSSDPKYAELRSVIVGLLRNPRQLCLDVFGFLFVGLAVAGGLLLSPVGLLANPDEVKFQREPFIQDLHLFGLRKHWPILLNPDGLLTIQQMLLGLGAALLLARGACNKGSNMLALGLVLLSAAQGLRAAIWLRDDDYAPEGPLGHTFAGVCSAIVLAVLTISATKAALSARSHGYNIIRGAVYLGSVLSLCAWTAKTNHMTAAGLPSMNIVFSLVDAVDLSAAPFLAVAACSLASEVSHLGGALTSFVVAQTFGLYWFLDFIGVLADPSSEDPIVQADLKTKQLFQTMIHGHPYALFAARQAICLLGALIGCGGYALLRFSAPDLPQAKAHDQPLLEVETTTFNI